MIPIIFYGIIKRQKWKKRRRGRRKKRRNRNGSDKSIVEVTRLTETKLQSFDMPLQA
jgi:hypothetical protein